MLMIKTWDIYSYVCFILLLVGGINTGIEGILSSNLLLVIFGNVLSHLVFLAIGGAAGYLIYLLVMERKNRIL
jgi:uncharacterized membrane protein YuzA (DUF378 family)